MNLAFQSRAVSIASGFLVRTVCFFLCLISSIVTAELLAEEITIDLSRGARDPLVDFVPPPSGSPDRVQFTGKGLHIQQTGDAPGRPTGVSGFKSTLAASGNFTMSLDVHVRKLAGSTDGWGHGLIFAVMLDDPAQTALKLNQLVYNGSKSQQSMVEVSSRSGMRPFYKSGPELREGKLIIQRIGSEAIFSIVPKGGSPTEIARRPCPTEDIRTVEVWSTRVDKGNSPSDILISKLTLESDGFYSFKKPVLGWFTWWQAIVGGHVIAILGLLIYRYRKNATANQPEVRR
jgi:hypothetical protein